MDIVINLIVYLDSLLLFLIVFNLYVFINAIKVTSHAWNAINIPHHIICLESPNHIITDVIIALHEAATAI